MGVGNFYYLAGLLYYQLHYCFHLLNKHLLRAYKVPHTMLTTGDTVMNKTDMVPALMICWLRASKKQDVNENEWSCPFQAVLPEAS